MIDCKEYVTKRLEKLKEYVSEHSLSNKSLAVIQIGDDPASNSYIKGKKADCEFVGIKMDRWKLYDGITTEAVIKIIKGLNKDDDVLGIIVQLPIPKDLDEELILDSIADEKDVDGFKVTSPFEPCTPKGVLSLLEDIEYDLEGKKVCVLGRGKTVGLPLVPLLIKKGATVISCNSKTHWEDVRTFLRNCDVLVSAIGDAGLIELYDFFNDEEFCLELPEVIIDVGISRDENGKLHGDVDTEGISELVEMMTPVPGGVGLYTRVSLLENTIYGGKRA